MLRKLFLVILAILCIYSVSFAAVSVKKDGVEQGVATAINLRGLSIPSNDGSTIDIGNEIEVTSTGDTLTASESGKTIIITATSGTIEFELPSASTDGLQFTFIDGKSTGANTFQVDPYSTNSIKYLTLDAGDKVVSPGATGDSITLISQENGYWFIKDRVGTFTDGGA